MAAFVEIYQGSRKVTLNLEQVVSFEMPAGSDNVLIRCAKDIEFLVPTHEYFDKVHPWVELHWMSGEIHNSMTARALPR